MTHEYVIAVRGVVLRRGWPAGEAPTAVAWAADRVLAVGSDAQVRAISRGDSTLLDLGGCAVTPAPADVAAAERLVQAAVGDGRPFDAVALMTRAGLLGGDAAIEVGAAADLAFWTADPAALAAGSAASLRIVATTTAGAFNAGDERRGPFGSLSGSPPGSPPAQAADLGAA